MFHFVYSNEIYYSCINILACMYLTVCVEMLGRLPLALTRHFDDFAPGTRNKFLEMVAMVVKSVNKE